MKDVEVCGELVDRRVAGPSGGLTVSTMHNARTTTGYSALKANITAPYDQAMLMHICWSEPGQAEDQSLFEINNILLV